MKIIKESIDIEGYSINDKTVFDTLRNISHNLFNFQSRLEFLPMKDYLLISKENLVDDYEQNIDNYEYFEYFSAILLMHINNVTFKTVYEKLYNFIEAPIYRIFDFDYDAYKRVYSPNVKKFVVNLDFVDDENGIIKFVDDPLLIKTCDKIDFQEIPSETKYLYIYKKTITPLIPKFKDILHEGYVGISLINITKRYLPNFSYTFCYAECSRPNLNENKKVTNWCNEEKNEYNIFPYVFKENVVGEKYSDFVKQCSIKEINILLTQYENAITLCNAIFMRYENRGVNPDNLIVYRSQEKVKIPIYDKIKKFLGFGTDYETNSYIETDLILYITDFTDVTIEYVSLTAEVTEYNTNTIENRISKNKGYELNNLLNYTKSRRTNFEYKKIKGKKGEVVQFSYKPNVLENDLEFDNDDDLFNHKMILYNNSCYINNKQSKIEFEKTISVKLNEFNTKVETVLTKEEILKTCEEYILFLIYMKGSTCFNFIHHMDNMYNIMTKLNKKLKEYHYPLYITNSLEYTMTNCFERLPIHNLFTRSNVISIFNMIKNLVMRICAYRLIYIIASEIFYNHPDVNLGTKILPLLVPSREGLGVPISLFKTISSFLVKNVMSKFLEQHWTFFLILFIQLYPDIITNVKSLWAKSMEVLDYLYEKPKYYKDLEIFSNKLKKQNDDNTWDVMKLEEDIDKVEESELNGVSELDEVSELGDINELDEVSELEEGSELEDISQLGEISEDGQIPRLNNNIISKILKYLLSLSTKEYNNVKNRILKGDFSMIGILLKLQA